VIQVQSSVKPISVVGPRRQVGVHGPAPGDDPVRCRAIRRPTAPGIRWLTLPSQSISFISVRDPTPAVRELVKAESHAVGLDAWPPPWDSLRRTDPNCGLSSSGPVRQQHERITLTRNGEAEAVLRSWMTLRAWR
jgi:hypothetical protein